MVIRVQISKVDKSSRGKFKVVVPKNWDRPKHKGLTIPKNAIYHTYNGHFRGDISIDNHVYWDAELNMVAQYREEQRMLGWYMDDVPKGVITQHRNHLKNWIEQKEKPPEPEPEPEPEYRPRTRLEIARSKLVGA